MLFEVLCMVSEKVCCSESLVNSLHFILCSVKASVVSLVVICFQIRLKDAQKHNHWKSIDINPEDQRKRYIWEIM